MRVKKGEGKKFNDALSGVYFRRCHICLHLNESENEVTRCERCQVMFAFESRWNFRQKGTDPLDNEVESRRHGSPRDGSQGKRPLTGLSVVW